MKRRIVFIISILLTAYILFILLPLGNFVFSFQNKSLHRDFQTMSESLVNRDFDIFMSFSPDLLVQSVGGKDKFRMYLELYEEHKENTEFLLKSSQLDSILEFQYKGLETQALFREISVFGNADTSFKTTNYLMGFKPLLGNWKFVSIGKLDYEELRKIMPSLSVNFREDLQKLNNRRDQ
jgi:hypothetical protein